MVPHEKGERIPLTISDYDSKMGTVSFAFHEVGKTTKELGCFNEGDYLLNVTGPLGNPSEVKKFGKVLCIGGSIMIAPLMLQVKAMKAAGNKVTTVLGARTKDFLIMEKEAKKLSDELYFATDDGSCGYKGLGFLNELLKKEKFDRCVVMGPVVMMKDVSEFTKPFGIPTVVTLTPIMIDGMGMCGACRVTVANNTKFACIDGPEFDAHTTNFDELIKRLRVYPTQEKSALESYEKIGGICKCQK